MEYSVPWVKLGMSLYFSYMVTGSEVDIICLITVAAGMPWMLNL
jgi:hypothetical protein